MSSNELELLIFQVRQPSAIEAFLFKFPCWFCWYVQDIQENGNYRHLFLCYLEWLIWCSFCILIFSLLAVIPHDVNTIFQAPSRVDDDGKCFRSSISIAAKHERSCYAPETATRISYGTRRCCKKDFETCAILFYVKSCFGMCMFQIFAGKNALKILNFRCDIRFWQSWSCNTRPQTCLIFFYVKK